MGQALTNRLTGLSATNARLVVSTAATVVVGLVAGGMSVAGIADGEVVATVLFLPVFLAALYVGRSGGFVAAAVALGVYVAVRRDDLSAADTASAVLLVATRGIAYALAAYLGAYARQLVGGQAPPALAGAPERPSPRAEAPTRAQPVPQWTEPAHAAAPDRGAPVLTGVGARTYDDFWSETPAPVTMSNAAGPPPAGPPSWGDPGPGPAPGPGPGRSGDRWAEDGAADDSWAAVQDTWRRQHGLPPEDPRDDAGGWPASAPGEDDTGRWSAPTAPAAPAPDWPAPAPGGPGWGAPPPAPDAPPPAAGNGRIPAADGWTGLAGDAWPAEPAPENGSKGLVDEHWSTRGGDDHGPATGETWAAVFTDPTTGRGPTTGEHNWGPDSWPATPAVSPDGWPEQLAASPDAWPEQPGASPVDSWPPTPAAAPDAWPHQAGPSAQDSWPPTPAAAPEAWPHQAGPAAQGSWPDAPAAGPDAWPHEPGPAAQGSWPPAPAAGPDAWSHQAGPAAQGSWPPTPAAAADAWPHQPSSPSPDAWPHQPSSPSPDAWPHQPGPSAQDSWPPAAGPDAWPHQPGPPAQDSWPPTPAAAPDGWSHRPSSSPDAWPQEPGPASRDSWPPTPAASPDATWAALAPPSAGDWPSPPPPALPGRPAGSVPSPPWAAAVPEVAPVHGGNGWSPPAGPAPPQDDVASPLPAVDPETGLWTARFLRDRLSAERARARRSRHPFSLVLVQVPDAPLASLPYRRQLTLLRELGYQFVAGGVVDHLVHVPDQEQHWFAVILPDTDRSGAQVLERRLRLGIGGYLSSRGLRLSELQSASLTAPDDDPAMSAIWDALIGPEDAGDRAAAVPEY